VSGSDGLRIRCGGKLPERLRPDVEGSGEFWGLGWSCGLSDRDNVLPSTSVSMPLFSDQIFHLDLQKARRLRKPGNVSELKKRGGRRPDPSNIHIHISEGATGMVGSYGAFFTIDNS
jgi:hypothetical protein